VPTKKPGYGTWQKNTSPGTAANIAFVPLGLIEHSPSAFVILPSFINLAVQNKKLRPSEPEELRFPNSTNAWSLAAIRLNSLKIEKSMTRYILVFILTFILAINTRAQQNAPTNKTALQEVVKGLFGALSDLDVDKAKSFCTTDITILESGKVWNFDSLALRITNRKAKSTDFKRVNKLDFIETKAFGDIAWIYYFNQATITFDNKTTNVKWLESAVIKKDKGKWKISLLHSTEIERTQ
jgi:Domain of unknown function (DUF4440)